MTDAGGEPLSMTLVLLEARTSKKVVKGVCAQIHKFEVAVKM